MKNKTMLVFAPLVALLGLTSALTSTGQGSVGLSDPAPVEINEVDAKALAEASADLSVAEAALGLKIKPTETWGDSTELSFAGASDSKVEGTETPPGATYSAGLTAEIDGKSTRIVKVFNDGSDRELFVVLDPNDRGQSHHITVEGGEVVSVSTEPAMHAETSQTVTRERDPLSIEVLDESAMVYDSVELTQGDPNSYTCAANIFGSRILYYTYGMLADYHVFCDLPGISHGNISIDPTGPTLYADWDLEHRTAAPFGWYANHQHVIICYTLDSVLYRTTTEPVKYEVPIPNWGFPALEMDLASPWKFFDCSHEPL